MFSYVHIRAHSHSYKCSRKFATTTTINKNVMINVGEVNMCQGTLKRRRGSKTSINVPLNANAKQILDAALKKLSDHNQYFCKLDSYTLLYPDNRPVNKIPGTDEIFRLDHYKMAVGKPFSKIDLFVCLSVHLLKKEHEVWNYSDTDEVDVDSSEGEENKKGKRLKSSPTKYTDKEIALITDITPPTPLFEDLPEDIPNANTEAPNKRYSICPICNIKVDVNLIEYHVNTCLEAQKTPFITLQNSMYVEPPLDNDEVVSSDSGATDYLDLTSGKVAETLSPDIIKTNIKEIIAKEFKMNTNMMSLTLHVSRGKEFDDFCKFFSKSWNKKQIGGALRIKYVEEAGIDTGGVSREFYTKAFEQVKTQFFTGNNSDGYDPAFGLVSATNGRLYMLGLLFASSLINQGPGPGFLSPWLFDYMIGGINAIILPVSINDDIYDKLYKESTDKEVVEILNSETGFDTLELIGFRGNPACVNKDGKNDILRSIFFEKKLKSYIPGVNEIMAGMENFNALHTMRKHSEFRYVFTPSEVFTWDYELLCKYLSPNFSEEGSNLRHKEVEVYKAFLDFVEACFMDDTSELKSEILMQYLTGATTIPPLGLPPKVSVSFKHDCKPSNNGSSCRCLPRVSTCALSILIPVHISTEEEMEGAFLQSIKDGQGFQVC